MALVNKEFVDVTILCSQSGGSVANWTFDAHKVKIFQTPIGSGFDLYRIFDLANFFFCEIYKTTLLL